MESYNEFIQNIINSRGQWTKPENGIYENHHIIPRCWGGEPQQITHNTKHENLVWLTPQEHYNAHKLLFLENPDDTGITNAFLMMCFGNPKKENGYKLVLNEYEYNDLRKIASENNKKRWDELDEKSKEEIVNNWRNSMNNRTEEEKELTKKKKQDTWNNHTEEEKRLQLEHIRDIWSNRTEEEKNKILENWRNSMNNRTEEEKELTKKKQIENWNNRSEKEKENIINKMKETNNNKTEEEKELTKKKKQDTWSNKTEKEKNIIKEKIKNSLNNRTEEEKNETHRIMSLNTSGKNNPSAKMVKCITTNEVFGFMKEAYTKMNISRDMLKKCLETGKPDKFGNYWEYYNL